MAKHFLFLEFRDPEINSLLIQTIEIVSGHMPKNSPHITVRGPYDDAIPKKTIASTKEKMKYDVLRISDVGRFSNELEEVVYFLVDSPNLRDVWYKPSFTIGEYGYNPHLSVYRGEDKEWADILYNFLQCENIELLCAEFQFVSRVTKQIPLISEELKVSQHFSRLITSGRVSDSFISRLSTLKREFEDKKNGKRQGFQPSLI